MTNVITTWMYSSDENESIRHCQIGDNVSSIKAQNYYWRCVFLLFKSSFENNLNFRHILFLNKLPPNDIDGIKTKKLIEQYRIEVVYFDKITLSPKDYYSAWNTQFLLLDILDWLAQNTNEYDNIFVLDSDIIINKTIPEELIEKLNNEKLLTYAINYSPEHVVNGLTETELNEVAKSISGKTQMTGKVQYSGGEIICCKGSELCKLSKESRNAYLTCLELNRKGMKKFNEEAHLLSYVYSKLGYKSGGLNGYIKRIWTNASVYRNVDGNEHDLVFLHLPDQKKRGYVKLFRKLKLVNGIYAFGPLDIQIIMGIKESERRRNGVFEKVRKIIDFAIYGK